MTHIALTQLGSFHPQHAVGQRPPLLTWAPLHGPLVPCSSPSPTAEDTNRWLRDQGKTEIGISPFSSIKTCTTTTTEVGETDDLFPDEQLRLTNREAGLTAMVKDTCAKAIELCAELEALRAKAADLAAELDNAVAKLSKLESEMASSLESALLNDGLVSKMETTRS
eukprot:gene1817-33236_t